MTLKRVEHFDSFELDDMLGNLLELLVDTSTGMVWHVNPAVGHAKAAAKLLAMQGKKKNEKVNHLVSAVVIIEKDKLKNKKVVTKIGVGNSSLESRYHVIHTQTQLDIAVDIINRIVRLSKQLNEVEITVNPPLEIGYPKKIA